MPSGTPEGWLACMRLLASVGTSPAEIAAALDVLEACGSARAAYEAIEAHRAAHPVAATFDQQLLEAGLARAAQLDRVRAAR